MSLEHAFVLSLAGSFGALFVWAFRRLPEERWQMIAALPVAAIGQDQWRGVNVTWYGAFTATAIALGGALLLVLMAAIGLPVRVTLVLAAAMLAIGLPAARIVARMVERQHHTFTVGGATFVALLAAPLVIHGLNRYWGLRAGFHIPPVACLAAFTIAYMLGEGVGRLACVSFGCCYGKPVATCRPLMRRLFARAHFVFHGANKKANYEGRADGQALLPIQAITSIFLVTAGLLILLLFFAGHHAVALVLGVAVSQGWRLISEFFRADFRGAQRISAYQFMAILTLPVALWLTHIGGHDLAPTVNLKDGLSALWSPVPILFLQASWLMALFFFGRSTVTGSTLSFHLRDDVRGSPIQMPADR